MTELEILNVFGSIVESIEKVPNKLDRNGFTIVKMKIKFKNGSRLDVYERLRNMEGTYSYHWRSITNTLIIRWDMGNQHPEIETNPYHLHIETDENRHPSPPMNIDKVLKYIMSILSISAIVLFLLIVMMQQKII